MVYAATKSHLKSQLGEDKFVDEMHANEPVRCDAKNDPRCPAANFSVLGRLQLEQLLRIEVLTSSVQPKGEGC